VLRGLTAEGVLPWRHVTSPALSGSVILTQSRYREIPFRGVKIHDVGLLTDPDDLQTRSPNKRMAPTDEFTTVNLDQ